MRAHRFTSLAVAAATFVAYLRTLCPTIFAGDSGELATAAATLGIAHPPGYPLWVLLGHLATRLAPHEPALGTNVFSALCAAAAAGVLAATLLRLRVRPLVAAAASLGYAFAAGPWSQAVITEVYALNQLFASLALYLMAASLEGGNRTLRAAAFVLGLGFANHPLVLLSAAPFLALGPRRLVADLPARIGLFVLGASFYLWVPVRAGMDPVIEWGAVDSLADAIGHVTRLQYRDLAESGPLPERLRVFAGILLRDARLPVLALALASLLPARDSLRRPTLALWGLFLVSGPLLAGVLGFEDSFRDRTVVSVFFLTATLAIYLLAGIGLERCAARLPRGRASGSALGAILLVALGAHAAGNWSRCDHSRSTLARDYAVQLLEALPANARIYAEGDNEVFALAYAQVCLAVRPDVEFVDRSLNLFVERYGDDFVALDRSERRRRQVDREVAWAFNEPDRPVFYASRVPTDGFGGCRLVPTGFLWQLLRPGEERISLPYLRAPMPPVQEDDALESMLAAGVTYRGALSAAREDDPATARARLEDAAGLGAEFVRIQLLAGRAWLDFGDRERARRCFERALEIDPDDEEALYALAFFHRDGQAAEYLARLVEIGAKDPVVHVLHSLQLALGGEYRAARDAIGAALRLAPDLPPARELETVIGIGLAGDDARARRQAASLRARWMAELARAQLANGEFELASSTFAYALELDPENPDIARQRGFALMQARRFEDAAAAFRQFLSLDGGNPAALNALAYVYAVTGDSLETATRLAQRAIDASSAIRPYALDTLGWARFRSGAFESALTALQAAAGELPEADRSALAENAFHRAMTLAELSRIDLARRAAEQARRGANGEFWALELEALERRLAESQ